MKKLMFLVSLVLIASFMLTACGPKATPTPEVTSAPATQPPATEAPTVAPTEAPRQSKLHIGSRKAKM